MDLSSKVNETKILARRNLAMMILTALIAAIAICIVSAKVWINIETLPIPGHVTAELLIQFRETLLICICVILPVLAFGFLLLAYGMWRERQRIQEM
jgi:hypothetical protein